MGSTFPQKIQSWQWVLRAQTPCFCCVNCKAFFTWVSDSVGGLLGGDKAYLKLTLKHHTDKVKRSMKVALKVSISCKIAFLFPGNPERPRGVLKAVFFPGEMARDFLEAVDVQRACSRLCPVWKMAL